MDHSSHDHGSHSGHIMDANTDIVDHSQHIIHYQTDGTSSPVTAFHHGMSMAFHFGYNETVLFTWWNFDTIGGLIGSCIVIFLLAVAYEGLKFYREYLFWKTYNVLEYRPVTGPQRNVENPQRLPPPQANASPVQYVGEVTHKQPPSILSMNHICQTLLHILQITISFFLMLIFMTFNVWLCLAVILGATVGYFVFCWKKSVIVDVTEHCH